MKITDLATESTLQEAPYGFGAKAADTLKGLVPGVGNTLKGVKQTADARRALGDFMNTVKREYSQDMKLSKLPTTQKTLIDWLQKKYPFADYKAEPEKQQPTDTATDTATDNDPNNNKDSATDQDKTTPGQDNTGSDDDTGEYKPKVGEPITYRSQKNPDGAVAIVKGILPNGKIQLFAKGATFAMDADAVTGPADTKDQKTQDILKKVKDQANNKDADPEVVSAAMAYDAWALQEEFESQYRTITEEEQPISGKQVDSTINNYVTQMYSAGAIQIDPKDPENIKHLGKQFKAGAAALDKAGDKFKKVWNKGGLDSNLDDKEKGSDDKKQSQDAKQGLSSLRSGLGLKNPQLALSGMNKVMSDQPPSAKEREAMQPLIGFMMDALANDPAKLRQLVSKYKN